METVHTLVLPPSSALLGMAAPFLSCRFSFHALHSRPLLPVTLNQLAVEEGTGKGGWVLFFQALLIWSLAGVMISLSNFLGPRCHFHFVV